ncbi:MAG: transposase [Patescibacteria group bacterium]
MPSRNILRADAAESYYHVYARGASKQPIFLEKIDYRYFENLLTRYLSIKPVKSKDGVEYPHLTGQIELLAYCLMNNHFHILLYQIDTGAMTKLMRSVMTSYSRYFNLKYKRTGSVFESRYKASKIGAQSYLEHISRYIHLNPRYWRNYEYSSLQYYRDSKPPDWLKSEKILGMFASPESYMEFVADYEENKQMLSELKHELADH